ncbi:serine hydrolase [Pseudoalteromonas sp. T1lg65]|uniref:serine hydrolase n=1 Tax=Pseudoalteromonas sp. T1lg65 TaxID=2077101 RepID=UPI003F78F6AD
MKLAFNTLALAISASLVLSGCNNDSDNRPPIEKAEGTWHQVGYGKLLVIDENRVKTLEFNSNHCILTGDFSHLETKERFPDIVRFGDILWIKEQGSTTNTEFVTKARKPEQCNSPLTIGDHTTPTDVFEYFWHAFNDYYAFFELRGVDWKTQRQVFRPLITDDMSDEALFDVLSEMVAPLQDAHVSIKAGDSEFFTMKPSPILRSAEGEAKSYLRFGYDVDTMEVVEEFFEDYEETAASYITEQSYKSFPEGDDLKTLIWGKTEDNIGIIVINNMAEYANDPEASESAQLAAAKARFDAIMQELQDTDGMIIDIRNNLGGDDVISMAIANHFNAKEIIAFQKQAVSKSGKSIAQQHKLPANANAYTKPVYLLTSQITVSAAEVFAMAMKQLPHVTQVGEETSGAFSDILSFRLPNGWEIGLSNEVYRNAQGEAFEKVGFQPDVVIPAYTSLETDLQRFATYDYALKQLGKQTYPSIDIVTFEHQVNDLMAQSGLPGLAVAVIQNGKLKYSNGFGSADEKNTPVTANTPFYLASVSKTMVGATLAHAVEDKLINLDEPIAPILPFTLKAISAQDTPITFAHLVTHTSGIVDASPAYTCSYYLHETQQNMNDALLGSNLCDEQINPDLGTYLRDYLSESGRNYQEINFTSQYDYETGEIYVYSNIATALAAYALEIKAQKPFTTLVDDYIFAPLAMQNSYWGVGKTADNVATRFVYSPDDEQLLAMPDYGAITYPDGSAISTVNDLAKYLIASMNEGKLGGHQLLSKAAVSDMLSPQTEVPVPSRDIGYFWELDGSLIHHDGSDPGVISQMIGDTKTKNGVILLSNGDDNHDPHYEAFVIIQQLALQLANTK